MKNAKIIIFLIIAVSFVLAFYFYPKMPEISASHWNIKGEVDGYMSKFWASFLMPIISLALFLLFILLPGIDPLKENVKKFRKYFDGFIIVILLFLLYIYLLTVFWNLGFKLNMNHFMVPAFSALLYCAGILVEKAKRNWFIGIRTPWTISNDRVWEKTHKAGGKLFKISALFVLLGLVFTDYIFYFFIVPMIALLVFSYLYSYLEYQKEISQKQ